MGIFVMAWPAVNPMPARRDTRRVALITGPAVSGTCPAAADGAASWGGDREEDADPAWGPLDAALLRAADELVADGTLGDATWAVLSSELDTRQLLDVIFTVGACA